MLSPDLSLLGVPHFETRTERHSPGRTEWGSGPGTGQGTSFLVTSSALIPTVAGIQATPQDWPPLIPVSKPSFPCQTGDVLFNNVNIQCWEGVRRWVYNAGKNINLSGKQFETTHQKSSKRPCPYGFILKK